MAPEPERDIQSVRRAVTILEAVARAGSAGVTQIAKAAGLHVATTHNLLRTLANCHFLHYANGRYRLGMALHALAAQSDPIRLLAGCVQRELAEVGRETGEASSCSVMAGHELRLLAFQPGSHAITIHYPTWIWPQALRLATGRLLVAHAPETDWPRFIEINNGVEPGWDAADWRREFARWREAGFAAVAHPHDGGQMAVAVPLHSADGSVVAALGASTPLFRATPELGGRMLDACAAAAGRLDASLGFSAPAGWSPPGEVFWRQLLRQAKSN